jgi:hypothetical protein
VKPRVLKMAGSWLWTCDHEGMVGDVFAQGEYRDPWSAAMATAIKHVALHHGDGSTAEAVDQ